MATINSLTTSYAGESAGKYVAAALLSANTIDKNGVTVKANIKYKEVLKKISLNDVVKDATCDFTATSTLTQTERILTPEEFQVNLQLCKKDFHGDWNAAEMGYSAHDVLPKSFADFIIAHVAAKVAAKNETNIWSGVTANAGEFDGFETLMLTAAGQPTAQEIAGTTLTAANIIAQAQLVTSAIPTRLYGSPDLKLYMPQSAVLFYIQALGGYGASGLGANGIQGQGTQWYTDGSLSLDGIPIFMANGMSDNVMICTTTENLVFGTGLMNDAQEVKVIDMADIDGSQNVRIVMRFTAGVQIVNEEDMVTYGITNGSN
jgi:hypothetical protein